jgi:FkbM family methyltransferase
MTKKHVIELLKVAKFITCHPLTSDRPLQALYRFARWQAESRIRNDITFTWIDSAQLIVKKGMTGATGNIYCGLHEFADMAFVLHMLRPGDLFVDAGANVGTYTILASKICGARSVSIEPDPETMSFLQRNIDANSIHDLVKTVEAALGKTKGVARFTVGMDTVNRMAKANDPKSREVNVECLDDILYELNPIVIKLDVEGFEGQVLQGGQMTLRKDSLLAVETETNSHDVIDQLLSAGFKQYFYDPIRRELSDTKLFESANSLYVRKSEVVEDRVKSAPYRKVFHRII